jgi:hypothetical protein
MRMDVEERRARLAHRHRLAPESRAADPVKTTTAMVALHSTDASSVFLTARARTADFAVEDLERALYEERTLVRMLGMRRTLWVVPRDLAPHVDAASTRVIAARERKRLEGALAAAGGVDDPAGWLDERIAAALEALQARGDAFTSDLTRTDPRLAEKVRLGAGRWQIEASAASRLLPLLAAEGKLSRGRPRGSWVSGQYRWVPIRAWLGGELERLEPAAAQAELLRRWLGAFGPATETDIRWWTGWTAREARGALAAVPHVTVDLDGSTGYVLAEDVEPTTAPAPWAALLPTLDPTTMGWKERDWYLGPHGPTLFDSNGNAGPTVWWDGRVVGGWSQRKDGEVVWGLLEDVGADARRAVEAEAERLADWLGDARIAPGFLPPYHRALAR